MITFVNHDMPISEQDKISMTQYYKRIYDMYQTGIGQSESQLKAANEMLHDDKKWNDSGAITLKKAAETRIRENKGFIASLIKKCESYLKDGKLDKFW